MKKIGLYYGFNTKKTSRIAEKIVNAIGEENIQVFDVETLKEEDFTKYDNMILGVSTWWDGELPTYWDEFMPAVDDLSLEGKKIAIFGLGDQEGYPENFADGIGLMAKALEERRAKIIGHTSTEGYSYEKSKAVKDGKFMGLALDQENQGALTNERILQWIEQIKNEFN